MNHLHRVSFISVVLVSALATLAACDSSSGVSVTEADSAVAHYDARPEYLHYSAHDMDTNRRESNSYDELAIGAALPDTFTNWESPHVHPLDLTPDNNLLLAVNTADAKLEVFRIDGSTPVNIDAIPVGLDPVSVRARSNTEAWVVNHISDSVSIVDLESGVVRHTLQTDDEPADVVFAGNPQRAFVTASQANTVMVFDPANLAAEPTTISIAGEDPRSLAVSLDGNTVYAAIFESGNASTVVRGGRTSRDYRGVDSTASPYGGQNPPPNSGSDFLPAMNPALPTPPRVSMIVKKNASGRWMDDNNGDWTSIVSGANSAVSGRINGWDLPDNDVAIIDANTLDVSYQSSLMNMVMGVSVNPLNGRVVVVGTDAENQIRFEPNLKSHFVKTHFADFPAQGGGARIVDLNSHLDPSVTFLPSAERSRSIGDPRSVTWGPSGVAGYVTAMGSNSILQINRNGSRSGDGMPVQVGEGPTASVVHEPSGRVMVLNRFDASISVVNMSTRQEELSVAFSFDPTPDFVNNGRRLLYDTQAFSGLGQASCASCHVDARYDRLAWDLGNPAGEMESTSGFQFHPMKGPMRTTSLIGVVGSPVLHFRGDKESLPDFSPTYTNLQGMVAEPTPEQMNQLETFIDTIRTPPNPFRNLDNTMPSLLLIPGPAGRIGNPHNPSNNCARCHNPNTNARGGLRNGGNNSPGQQTTTSPSLRSMYEILGMSRSRTDSTAGFAFIADGANDTQAGATLRNNNSLAFMMAFNGDLPGDTHAAVGTQITWNGSQTPEDNATLTQLVEMARTGAIGLVAHGLRDNGRGQRGFTYVPESDRFATMGAGFTTLANLQSGANANFPMTFTAVPAGTEFRIGVDRDDDGTYDLNDTTLGSVVVDTGDTDTENLISNGAFSANMSDWATCGGTSTVTGGVALLSSGGCIYQEFAVSPGAEYGVSCDALSAAGFASVQLSVSSASYTELESELTEVTSATLASVDAELTAPDGSYIGAITLYANQQASFDNCVVTVESVDTVLPTEPAINERLLNADFSSNLANWTSCGGQQALSADGVDGGSSLALSSSGCMYQEFPVTVGEQYETVCVGKSEQGYSSMTFTIYDSDYRELDARQQVLSNTNQYQDWRASMTAPENGAVGAVTLYGDSSATFDSCGVIAVSQ